MSCLKMLLILKIGAFSYGTMISLLYSAPLICCMLAFALLLMSETQIPKPNTEEGLGIGWPATATDMDKLKQYFNELKSKI